MAVTPDEVLRIAALARLRLDPEGLDRWVGELNGILAHVERLAGLDLESDGPDRAPTGDAGGSGEAVPPDPDPLPPTEPGRSAPAWRDGFFLVPRIPGQEDR